METDGDVPADDRRVLAEALRSAERAGAAPFLDFPPSRWWEPWAMSAWAGAQTWLISRGDDDTGAWRPTAQALLLLLVIAYLTWQRRRHGALPMRFWGDEVPPEITGAYARYLAGVLVVVAIMIALIVWTPGWIAVAGAVVLTNLGVRLYDHDYRAAALRARERLA